MSTPTIHLSFTNSLGQASDPAQLSAVAAHVAGHFRRQGQPVTPRPTGARSGEWFDLVLLAADQINPAISAMGGAASLIKTVLEIRKLLQETNTAGTVTVTKDATSASVAVADPRSDEAILAELLAQLPSDLSPDGASIAVEIEPRGELPL